MRWSTRGTHSTTSTLLSAAIPLRSRMWSRSFSDLLIAMSYRPSPYPWADRRVSFDLAAIEQSGRYTNLLESSESAATSVLTAAGLSVVFLSVCYGKANMRLDHLYDALLSGRSLNS